MWYLQMMYRWLKSLYGLPSRLQHFLLDSIGGARLVAFIALLALTGCSGMSPLSLLTGGGPNVAANTQIGKTNNQTVGTTSNLDANIRTTGDVDSINQDFDSNNKVATDRVENLTINEIPVWVILLLVLGWLLPTPSQIGQGFLDLFRKRK
jgi:hypothetical protein